MVLVNRPRLRRKGSTTVFEVMSSLARERQAINLGQGFPDDPGPEDVRRKAADATLSKGIGSGEGVLTLYRNYNAPDQARIEYVVLTLDSLAKDVTVSDDPPSRVPPVKVKGRKREV